MGSLFGKSDLVETIHTKSLRPPEIATKEAIRDVKIFFNAACYKKSQ